MNAITESQIGPAIRELRTQRGMSQQELARLSGVPQQTISGLEADNAVPKADTLLAIAEALGITPDIIYQTAGLLLAEDLEDANLKELYSVARKLSPRDRKELREYALLRYRLSQEES